MYLCHEQFKTYSRILSCCTSTQSLSWAGGAGGFHRHYLFSLFLGNITDRLFICFGFILNYGPHQKIACARFALQFLQVASGMKGSGTLHRHRAGEDRWGGWSCSCHSELERLEGRKQKSSRISLKKLHKSFLSPNCKVLNLNTSMEAWNNWLETSMCNWNFLCCFLSLKSTKRYNFFLQSLTCFYIDH